MKTLAHEVSSVLKKAAGVEALGSALVAVQAELSGKKFQRKRTKAHEVRAPFQLELVEPEVFGRWQGRRERKGISLSFLQIVC